MTQYIRAITSKVIQFSGPSQMATRRSLCTGCQKFVTRLYDPAPLDGEALHLHDNFAALSKCAIEVCDLCQFICREFYFYYADNERYYFTDQDLQNNSKPVSVELYRTVHDDASLSTRGWAFLHGDDRGPYYRANKNKAGERLDQRQTPVYHPNIDKLLLLSKQWLSACIAGHGNCGPKAATASPVLPTRLIDVGTHGQPIIRLVLSEDFPKSEQVDYLTLSYCWGPSKHSDSTTGANYEERLKGFAISSLPKTFEDAIAITRALEVRYLWVDALCIIQPVLGDKEDWEREFPNMGRIYQNSVCTIAASGAEHKDVGCFYRKEAAQWPVSDYVLEHPGTQHKASSCAPLRLFAWLVFRKKWQKAEKPPLMEMKAKLPNWIVSVEHSPLAKRGWVLQERMLASRTLFWTKEGLFWDCAELHASEYESSCGLYGTKHFPLLQELADYMGKDGRERRFNSKRWVDVLEEYSQKNLTVMSDKLPALTGLGNTLSQMTGKEYDTVGIWRFNTVQELAWFVDFTPRGEDGIIPQPARLSGVPTWSWASMSQRLWFQPGRHVEQCSDMVGVEGLTGLQHTVSENVGGYHLKVRGRLGQLRVKKLEQRKTGPYGKQNYPNQCTFEPAREATYPVPSNRNGVIALFDTLEDALPEAGGLITCIMWIKWTEDFNDEEESDSDSELEGLWMTGAMIISVVNENEKVYRRLGWADLVDDSFFSQDEEIITLI